HLDTATESMRPGMSCSVEIILAEYEEALFVPVQSVLRVGPDPVVYVRTARGPLRRPIRIGLDNNRMVHVLSGLEPGDRVLLAPPLTEGEAPLNSGPREIALPDVSLNPPSVVVPPRPGPGSREMESSDGSENTHNAQVPPRLRRDPAPEGRRRPRESVESE
ncbi:MAG: hypothetical protein U1E27_06300, partial [Kiritimatiellia bacterium]|nr:hypothetical protein [Kiritimatiellia bacterium]